MTGEFKGVGRPGRESTAKEISLPNRPSELKQLWRDVVKAWVWPALVVLLLAAAIYRNGAESPLDSMVFSALACALLATSMVDRDNRRCLSRLSGWKWAGIGLFLVWTTMLVQLLPLPFLSGGPQPWTRADSVTVDPDLTLRAIVSMGSAVAFFMFGAIFGADRQRREIILLLVGVMFLFIFLQAIDSHFSRAVLFELAEQKVGMRMEGTFLNANSFAILMVMFLSGCIGALFGEAGRYKGMERVWVQLFAALLALGAVYCIYLTMSRAAWLLTLFMLFGLALLIMPNARLQTGLFGFASLLVLLIIWNSAEQLGLPIRQLELSQGFDGRFLDWQPGLDLTAMRPVLGWGAGSFARAMEPCPSSKHLAQIGL